MKYRIDIRGVIIPNDYKWIYDLFGMDSTCQKDVLNVLDKAVQGDVVEVFINSPGGVIDVGSEIYTALRASKCEIKIYITGQACSAASIIAMAGYCEMSPTALMMVHCVSTSADGNHSVMEHTAQTLRTADRALCTAYVEKTGMSEADALAMMEQETWLTAEQAKTKKLVDKIMFGKEKEPEQMIAGLAFNLPKQVMVEQIKIMMEDRGHQQEGADKLLQQKLNLLKLSKPQTY